MEVDNSFFMGNTNIFYINHSWGLTVESPQYVASTHAFGEIRMSKKRGVGGSYILGM